MKIHMYFVFLLALLYACSEKNIVYYYSNTVVTDTIPFDILNYNGILVNVRINEKVYNFVFDTGSEKTIINSIIPSISEFYDTTYFYDAFDNRLSSNKVKLDSLHIGNLHVVGMDSYLQRDLYYDGILGNDILGKMVWKIDLMNQQIISTKDIKNLRVSGTGIPFRKVNNSILFPISINGIKVEACIDTGYQGFMLLNTQTMDKVVDNIDEAILWEDIRDLHSGNTFAIERYSPPMDSLFYILEDVYVDGIALRDEIIKFHRFKLNFVGMDFFKRFEYVILDYPNSEIYFGPSQKKSLEFLKTNMSRINSNGIILSSTDNLLQIKGITSDAKDLGLKYLDTVLSINGISIVDRDSLFYRNSTEEFQLGVSDLNISEYRFMIDRFHFVNDTSLIEVKRGKSSDRVKLIRKFHSNSIPESIADTYVDLNLPLFRREKIKTASSYYYIFDIREVLSEKLRNR